MKILVAPLNWGLGHASRCVPLIHRLLDEGNEVIIGGDGESLTLLRKHFPRLRYVYLAPLRLRYSKGSRQVLAMLIALPKIIAWAVKDHAMLKAVLREEPIDRVISDNRFGLFLSDSPKAGQTRCVYMTHQLHIPLPRGWRWLEPLAERLHARVYAHYYKVWVPDYEAPDQSLAGDLSHPQIFKSSTPQNIEYIGPLSRFNLTAKRSYSDSGLTGKAAQYETVVVLSGLEPHRTILEQQIIARFSYSANGHTGEKHEVLIVQGLMNRPNTRFKRGNITIVPYMSDEELVPALVGAKHIIARSGYSTIMDLEALGLNHKSELIPTPGQPEQEYLAARFAEKNAKKC